MAGLALNAITKSYGSVSVIEGVSLSVADGEFVALVGPSGCGKSTILRMIAGLEDISGGEISIGGNVVNELTPRERNVAMVFQTYALYPHMNVYKNMAFNLELSRQPKDEIDRRVMEAARMLELESLLERKPSELSGGQRQRVAMGRAIVRNPAVFLFDEPLSNLDAKLRVQMRSEIKALHTKVGVTSVYVTHDQVEAMTLADRVVVLNQGAIQQEGTPLELYRRPANMFVAGFIGSPSMNFFDAVIDGDSAVTPAGIRFAFSSETPIASGTKVVVGIRPEHFITGSGPILARVEYVEPTGGQSYVMTSIGDAQAMIVVSGDLEIKAGDTVSLEAPPSRTYLFEPEGGKRISQN